MHKNTKLRLGAVASLTVAVMALGALPANADPGSANPFPTLVGVGSDTTANVMNGLSTLAPATFGSFDAVAPNPAITTIVTRSGGTPFKRPDGSGDGVFALGQAAQGGLYNGVAVSGYIDFARSSSGPSGSTGVLTYIPFGIDALTYAYNGASAFPTDVPLGTAATDTSTPLAFNLRNIYQCRVTTFPDASGNDQPITPLIPQSGSGTRSFWLGQMGLTETTLGSTYTCVTDRSGAVQEHTGTALTGAGDIMPFSIPQYIQQGRYQALASIAPVTERRGNAVLGKIGTISPFTLSGTTLTANAAFPIKRTVYNVVQTSRLGETLIANTFVGSTSTVCGTAGQAIIKAYGFALAPNCGVTTITGAYRTGA